MPTCGFDALGKEIQEMKKPCVICGGWFNGVGRAITCSIPCRRTRKLNSLKTYGKTHRRTMNRRDYFRHYLKSYRHSDNYYAYRHSDRYRSIRNLSKRTMLQTNNLFRLMAVSSIISKQ